MDWSTCVASASGIGVDRPFLWIHDSGCRKLINFGYETVQEIYGSEEERFYLANQTYTPSRSIQEKETGFHKRGHVNGWFADEDFPDMSLHDCTKGLEKDSISLSCDPDRLEASSIFFNSKAKVSITLQQLPKSCKWENLTIEQAFQHMSNLHCSDDYLERCVNLIQKCKRRGCAATAICAYAHLCAYGLEVHGFLGSYLVAMFVQSGKLPLAQQVFSRLLYRSIYSWTHLMQGYIEEGDPEYGFHLFNKMKEAGIRPSSFAYVLVLRACTALRCMRRGKQLHTEIVTNLEEDLFVTRALLDFYVKCSLSSEASDVFNDLRGHTNFVEDDLIRLYKNQELVEDPLACVHDVPTSVAHSTALAHVFTLKACSRMNEPTWGHELHMQVVKEGFDQDYFVSNTLIDMYAKCGLSLEAWIILKRMAKRDVVSWTALITGSIENGLCNDALNYMEMMGKEGVPPNAFTLVSCLKGCSISQSLDSGRKLHAQIMKEGLHTDFVICNSLVGMYARCGLLEEAHDVFDKFARQDVISWTLLISGFTDHGLYDEAIACFTNMVAAGVSPNVVAYNCCLKACAFTTDLDMGRKLHCDLVKEEFETHTFVGNALVHLYARCGSCLEAKAIFDDLSGRDVISWTIMIAELAEDGQGEKAFKMFEQMHDEGLSPNSHTFCCGLKACGTIGAIGRGRMLHIEITKRGLEQIPFITKALSGFYAECGKPISL
ncbi:hypothetical protein L7F22_035968 [Adiantum nelumboides]|nr:hypothetical protein [Adiantum nelumboides]